MSNRAFLIPANGRPLSFPSKDLVKRWEYYDKEVDVVFSTSADLAENNHLHVLEEIYTRLKGEGPPASTLEHLDLAKTISSLVAQIAQPVNKALQPGEKHLEEPLSKKAPELTPGKRHNHKVYGNDQKIIKLLDTPPVSPGTHRHRNMQVVMDAKTVGEALAALRALTPKGVPADIDLAVEKRAVEIK